MVRTVPIHVRRLHISTDCQSNVHPNRQPNNVSIYIPVGFSNWFAYCIPNGVSGQRKWRR